MNAKNVLITSLVVVLGVAAAYAGTQFAAANYSYNGSVIDPDLPAYEFSLTSASGKNFDLKEHRGEVTLIFFGYANCPDVCPTTLAEFRRVHEDLGELTEQVNFIFITIDPERDTPEMIETYASAFNPDFLGLSGTEEELGPVWDAFFVYRAKSDVETAAGYLMEHSARVVVVDKFGNFRMTFPFGIGYQPVVQDVRHLLAEELE